MTMMAIAMLEMTLMAMVTCCEGDKHGNEKNIQTKNKNCNSDGVSDGNSDNGPGNDEYVSNMCKRVKCCRVDAVRND